MGDERHAEPVGGDGRHELGADRRAAHREHDDALHRPVAVRQRHGACDASGLSHLAREGGDPAEHVPGVDPAQDGRVVQGDRLVELRRRVRLVSVALLATPGLLVRVLVAKEVPRVHGRPQLGTPEAASERPSASSASTSAGERAST